MHLRSGGGLRRPGAGFAGGLDALQLSPGHGGGGGFGFGFGPLSSCLPSPFGSGGGCRGPLVRSWPSLLPAEASSGLPKMYDAPFPSYRQH